MLILPLYIISYVYVTLSQTTWKTLLNKFINNKIGVALQVRNDEIKLCRCMSHDTIMPVLSFFVLTVAKGLKVFM